jgi:ABC-2 type transport system ATP-binding protein
MKSTETIIKATGLKKSFKDLIVLNGIDLSVCKGEIVALLGPNGTGKTTIVRILTTLLRADSGTAIVDGFDVNKQSDAVRGSIGLTGQYAAIDEYLTGMENLVMMGQLYRLSKADSRTRASELLKRFDLEDAADRTAKNYSGGMRRRLDLAASLIASPPVIFLDEPTTGLDPRSRQTIWEIIKTLAAAGTTILLTTQYLEEADQLADRIVVIDGGKVIAEGTADELKQKIGNERLELVIDAKSDFAKAQSIIVGEAKQVDAKRRTISIATTGGVAQLKKVLALLEAAKVDVESLSLHKPTLDDVFLNLTGRTAVAETEEDETPKKGAK